MDFLSGLAKSAQSKPEAVQPTNAEHPSNADHPAKHSSSDLLADAKVVAAAAQAQFSKDPQNCDKAKAASSAADLLDAAEGYAKLDSTKGVGKYAEQAEGYLRQYSGGAAGHKKTEVAPPPAGKEETSPTPAATETPSGAGEKSEGGYGDMLKTAGGFFK
ncbi:hypothetical protein ACS0TY_009795 [Phlomoides rotata]